MAKADRLARLDEHRAELETDYAAALVAALRIRILSVSSNPSSAVRPNIPAICRASASA